MTSTPKITAWSTWWHELIGYT